MKLFSVIKNYILVLFFLTLFAIALALGCAPRLSAFASEEKSAFEGSDVLSDLEGMGINVSDYPYDPNGNVALFAFQEYGFSEFKNVKDDYGIYIYVYNPQELDFIFPSVKNLIEIGSVFDEMGVCTDYDKYQLELLDSAENGRYLKLKICAGEDSLHDVLDVNERKYNVSSLELCKKGDLHAEDYDVSTTFFFTGFAKGYAVDNTLESTLSCRTEVLETIKIDVKHTTYKVYNTDNKTGQELATVYFNVPERYFDEYGALQQIKAEWLYSVTDYIYCTWYKNLYDALLPYVGKEVVRETDLPYYFYSSMTSSSDGYHMYWYDVYNVEGNDFNSHVISRISTINWLMPNYLNSSEELINYYKENQDENLFGHIDADKTTKVIDAGDKYDLKGLGADHTGWEWLWEYLGFTNTVESVCPIYTITDNDYALSNEEFATTLKVKESDVDDIKEKHLESGSRTVLFRFAVNDFESQDLFVSANDNGSLPSDFTPGKGLLYRTKIPLYQDFDVIWLGFQKAGTMTIVPAVSNPVTVIGSTEPPLDNDNKDWSGDAFVDSVLGDDWESELEDIKRYLLIAVSLIIGLFLIFLLIKLILWLKPQKVKLKIKNYNRPFKSRKTKSVKAPKL